MADYFIDIDSRLQRLYLWEPYPDGDMLIREYPISTARSGLGEQNGSYCTPRGRHRIAEKIGDGQPLYAVFKARVPTGEVWSRDLAAMKPDCDWILTRILWLEGLEEGKNKGGTVDSHLRYIYIHGTDEEHLIGTPVSHGCIRMKNEDIVDLFDRIDEGTLVNIG
jgi:hypothetical protein